MMGEGAGETEGAAADVIDDATWDGMSSADRMRWRAAQSAKSADLHRQHLAVCGVTDLFEHGYGWGNCPVFAASQTQSGDA